MSPLDAIAKCGPLQKGRSVIVWWKYTYKPISPLSIVIIMERIDQGVVLQWIRLFDTGNIWASGSGWYRYATLVWLFTSCLAWLLLGYGLPEFSVVKRSQL